MNDDFKVNNFDLLRLAAASQVMWTHAALHLGLPPSWGWVLLEKLPGVPVFFVISGFLISASLERSRDLRSYFHNRALRIYPALWCCLLLTLLAAAACGQSVWRLETIPWLAAQAVGLIYTPQFLEGFGMGSYNGSLWTIPIELQFYLLLPLLYALGQARPGRTGWVAGAFVVFVAVAVTMRLTVPGLGGVHDVPQTLTDQLLRYSFLPHVYLFLGGVLLQRLKAHTWRVVRGKGLYWLAGYMALSYAPGAGELRYFAGLLMLGMATISLAYTLPGLSQRLLRHHDISYGVYVYHGLLMNVFIEIGWMGRWRDLLLLALLTYGAALLSWLLVERPALRLKSGRHASGTAAPLPAGANPGP